MTPLDILDIGKIAFRLARDYPALRKRPYWSREELANYQLGLLRKRLRDARGFVPLYANRLPAPEEIATLSDWSLKVPLLSKSDLLAQEVRARLHRNYAIEDLIVSKSSGSTGQALDVYYDREGFYLFVLAGLRLYQMVFPYYPWKKQTYIYTSSYPFSSLFGFFPMEFISTLNPIADTIAQLRKNPPDLLVCYPSHLRAILDQMCPEDFARIRPQAVNVNSEMSSAMERKALGERLHSFVFDDYSSEELTRIASQCRELQYHIFDDINYLEIVDDHGRLLPEGVVGNIVGTNLHNRAMPLLRYLQGDRGAIRSGTCACGRNFRILEKLEGRKNDAFLLPNGQQLSSGFLLDLTYGVILDYEKAVRGFCLLQEEKHQWILEIVPGAQWSAALAGRIPADLERYLAEYGVRVQLKIVEQVTRTNSGKANPIISRLKKE